MNDAENIELVMNPVTKINCHKCGEPIDVSHEKALSKVICPACHVELPVPALLGPFILFKEMGKGAMGAVYQGFDQTLKRHAAIKVMLTPYGKDPVFVEKFLREARALAALNHTHVVQVYSCGQENDQPYIVMELLFILPRKKFVNNPKIIVLIFIV
ncbi:MAG: protein kinase [Kiritimatiellae bacterium]|nr:protein kinase [Kiritimatiellia bacterium]